MIYLSTHSNLQVVMIPNNGLGETGAATLLLRSTTQGEDVVEQAAFISASTGLYHHVGITLPEGATRFRTGLKTGEYEYRLTQGGKTLSSGRAQVGEYGSAVRGSEAGGILFRQGK